MGVISCYTRYLFLINHLSYINEKKLIHNVVACLDNVANDGPKT